MADPTEPAVLHRDRDFLVLFKPSGLPTTAPDRGPCLVDVATRLDPKAPHLHPSSRLDAEVSGIVTFARTRDANRALLEARGRGCYERLYVGLAAAVPEASGGSWEGFIGLDPADRRKRRVVDGGAPGARAAHTHWERHAVAGGVCLLRLFPRTGRTHQLRVHAAAAGVPLVGDVHYGGPRRTVLPDGRVVTARRAMLHCAAVRITLRARSAPLDVGAAPPGDFVAVWSALGGDGALLESAARMPETA